MSTSQTDRPRGKRVWFAKQGAGAAARSWLMVELVDGRSIGVPLSRYPTLARASTSQRAKYRSIGGGDGFHWPGLDLDLSVEGIVEARAERGRSTRRKSA